MSRDRKGTRAVTAGALWLALVAGGAACQVPDRTSETCWSSGCHDGYGKKKVVHSPVSSESCDACHEVVDAKAHRFKLTADMPGVCIECHDGFGDDLKFKHGPMAAGECTACHDPHASDHAKLLTAEGNALCLDCHSDLADRLSEAKLKHEPATSSCATCHRPHGGDNKMFLTAKVPGLCTDCHDGISDLMEDAEVKHGVMTEANSCSRCHDPHASDAEHFLKREPMAICLECHEKPVRAADSEKSKIIGFGKLLEENPVHHAPIAQGDCITCHKAVHGGERARLLSGAYPTRFYAPFGEEAYGLCFTCHDAELAEEKETDEATGFRNGEQNLHYVHVNKKAKGRTCRTCHEVHASKRPRLIAESVPFGKRGWRLPINFTKTETGGSCLPGCHKSYGYDRDKPVANLPPIPRTSGSPSGQ